MGFLHDQAVQHNSLFVGVTETWLHEGVLDAEVTHAFPGYNLSRSDRAGGRQGGGVALYLREDLTGDILSSYTEVYPPRGGSICELLAVKVHQLDILVCVLYKPPDTRIEEFSGMLKCLDETLSALPSPAPTVILMGDFNFPKTCITWQYSEEGILVPIVAGHRDGETAGGKQDRLQAQQLIELSTKHSLLQEVDQATHAAEILDLVFTNNCELLSSINQQEWRSFTDHKLVIANVNYMFKQESSVREEQFLCDTGKRYKALDFYKAPWEEIKSEISSIDWKEMDDKAKSCPTAALSEFHEKLLKVLEKLVPVKKKKSGKKPKMHRMRRLLWKRHAKAKRHIKSSSSISKLSENLQKMWELESQLSADYTAASNMEEDEAVLRIKSNPKAFFSFARSRQKVKAKVGPFLDPSTGLPNPSPDFAAESLRTQYNSIFSAPNQPGQ